MAIRWSVIECKKSLNNNYYEELTIEESYQPNFVMKFLFSNSVKQRRFYGNSTVWYELPTFRMCDEMECETLLSLQRQWHYEKRSVGPTTFLPTYYN